jgi:enoyl-CoA hydratase/carnithine racemase
VPETRHRDDGTETTLDPTQLRYEVADGVATVTLHRPDRLNTFTLTMAAELAAVAAAADADDAVRVVVVTSAAARARSPTAGPASGRPAP